MIMTEQVTLARATSIQAPTTPLTAPTLVRSSEPLGWDGLVVQEYDEPDEIEDWLDPIEFHPVLMLLTHGSMQVEYLWNGVWNTLPFSQGTMTLRPAGSENRLVRWRRSSAGPLKTLHLHLDQQLVCRVAEELAGHVGARLSLIRQSGFQDPLLSQMGFALRRELAQPTSAGKLYAQTAAQMLAVHLLRHYNATPVTIKEPAQGLTSRQLKRVTDFLLEHLSEDLSLEVLAAQSGFSAYHFARLFRQATGESPHQFVLRQRIEHAQRLLDEADLPLAQVAAACGFANQSHFTQVFKRYLGYTPRAYQARARS